MLEAEVIAHRHHVHTSFSRTRTQHDNSMDIGMDSSNFPQVRISVQDFIHQSWWYRCTQLQSRIFGRVRFRYQSRT